MVKSKSTSGKKSKGSVAFRSDSKKSTPPPPTVGSKGSSSKKSA